MSEEDQREPSQKYQREYRPEYVRIAKTMCRMGATMWDLAEAFGVDKRSVTQWMSKHKAFANAVKLGKEPADDRVERSLYERAVGYTFEAEKVFCHRGQIVRATVIEHVPPDPMAALKWLQNRRPDQWRERGEHTVPDLAAALRDIADKLPV